MGPHIDYSKLPEQICQVIQVANFPLVTDVPKTGTLQPSEARFHRVCESILSHIIKNRQKGNSKTDPQVWTPFLLQTVRTYVAKHQLKAQVVFEKPTGLPSPLMVSGGVLGLSLIPPNAFTESSLLYALDHEVGHLRDFKRMGEILPDSKPFLEKGRLQFPEFMFLIFSQLLVMEKKMTPPEKARFEVLIADVFHNFEGLTIHQASERYTIITELFRWGEEIHDPRFEANSLNDTSFSRYRKKTPEEKGKETNSFESVFALAGITASLQEAGLWNKMTRRKDYDADKVGQIDPKMIEFCRLAIRASSRYFQSPPVKH